MNKEHYFRLYSLSAEPEDAYLLADGNVFFFVTDYDKYSIKGKNLILGSTEIILNRLLNMKTPRIESAVAEQSSVIKRMPAGRFLASMNTYSFVLNVSMVLARQVMLTNLIINKNLSSLEGDEKKNRELSSEYYRIVHRLKREYEKRKYPWLSEILRKYENSLTYKRGEAFERSAEPTKISTSKALSGKMTEYPRGSIICEEGQPGDEMYILQSGTIDVYIGGNRVTSVSDTGYVFGEISLLIGEKRTATLKAKNDIVLTKIKKADLPDVAAKQNDILTGIATSLARKHFYNIMKINSVNRMIVERKMEGAGQEIKKPSDYHRASSELYSLKKDVTTMYEIKKADFLKDLVDKL